MPAIRVFLAEDEFAVREGIRENLDWEGMGLHFVGQAQDGEVALLLVHELKPDIIITDIKMPFMDGLAFSRAVRKTMPWVKIIILTGFDDFNFAREALSIGVTAYILKPVNAEELSATILKVAADIEQERQFSRNIEALRNKVEETIPLLTERFLNDIVTGTLTAEAIHEKAREHGIDILAPFYAVVAIELETSAGEPIEKKRLDQMKLDSIVRKASSSGSAIGFIGSLGRLILIVKGEKSGELEQSIYCLAEKIKSDAKSDIGNRVTIGIGGIVERLTDLPRSYRQAEEAVKSRPMHEESWISSSEPAEAMTKNKAGGKQNSEKLLDFFKFGEMKEVEDFLSSYTGHVRVSMNSRQFLHYMVLDFIFAAESFVLDIGGEPSAIIPSQEKLDQLLLDINSPSSLRAWARALCSSLLAHRDAVRKNKHGELIRRAKDFIAAHYADNDISLKTVAEAAGMSASRFSTVFSQGTGTTFIDYITQIRISRAMELLKSSSLRASEITYSVGYSDPHYFSYIFKKTTGRTPTEFRGA